MNQNTYIINASIDTMQTQKEINVKNKKESDLIEIIEEIGMAETNAYLLYGEPQVGKTRLALKLAEIYSDLGFTPKFIVTEVNWGMKFGGKSMLELVRQKFGADSAYIPRNIENILTLEVPNKPVPSLRFIGLCNLRCNYKCNANKGAIRFLLRLTQYS